MKAQSYFIDEVKIYSDLMYFEIKYFQNEHKSTMYRINIEYDFWEFYGKINDDEQKDFFVKFISDQLYNYHNDLELWEIVDVSDRYPWEKRLGKEIESYHDHKYIEYCERFGYDLPYEQFENKYLPVSTRLVRIISNHVINDILNTLKTCDFIIDFDSADFDW